MQNVVKSADPSISIIVPVLNEAGQLESLCASIDRWHARDLIIVDGGSADHTATLLQRRFDARDDVRVLVSAMGRAEQMQCGARVARHAWLLFVHADTQLPREYVAAIATAEQRECGWGRFDVRFKPTGTRIDLAMRIIAFFINVRSRLTRIATGDQAIFVRADLFAQLGGFAQQTLMEDIELCKRLKRHAPCLASRLQVTTSPRRWQERGVIRTVLLMWVLRFGYYVGVSPERLARLYVNVR